MAEYIEREAVLDLLTNRDVVINPNDEVANIREDIECLPAADVRPVVRGTWVGIDDFPHEDWECDHCGSVVGNTDDPWNYYHYCPNCGAKMEES